MKVLLQEDDRPWRTVEVLESQTLHDLHRSIQTAFDWDNDHLYAFFMTRKAWDNKEQYGHPYVGDPAADTVSLEELRLRTGKKFLYIFDFGDDWPHEITVVGKGVRDDGATYPRILESEGAAPSQYGELDEEL